ncbi:MAG TPA: TolC family outer membrane protein [Burkholderiaceae bacterium]|nr:TolC family outer membrane protein [Burkholderiaceae bacterium]
MAADHRLSSSSRPRASVLAATLGLLFGGVSMAQAQSLQELYDAARAYDASYLAARAQAESAEFKAGQADALARPTVGAGASAYKTQTHTPSYGTVTAAGPVTVPAATLNSTATQVGLSAKYSVYNRGNRVTIEQAQRGLGVARADLESAEQDLIVRVSQAYFDVLNARDTLATAQGNKKAVAEQLASAKRNFEVGTATITDTREAQARYDLATAQELAADNDLRVKQVSLDQIVGRVGVDPKPLAQPVALPALASDQVETWVAQSEQHPLIRKAQLGLEVARLETEKAKAANGPTVDANGSLGVVNNRGDVQMPGSTRQAKVGLELNIPLYTGGYNDNRIKETLKLEEKSRNDLDFARRSISEATKRAFFGVQSLRAQVKAYEAAEASTKLALEATQLGYKLGVRVNLDVLNAQTQLFSTQRDLAKARYDVVLNSLKLRQASGQLRPEDLAAVNALLAK